MKKLFWAASAAVMAAAMAPSAQAAVIANGIDIATNDLYFESQEPAVGAFSTDMFFTITSPSVLNITANSVTGVIFTKLFLDGVDIGAGVINVSPLSQIYKVAINVGVLPNPHKFTFVGTSTGAATSAGFNGNVSLSAVPEPTTWAMMIAGIAVVGMTMRRRAHVANIAFS
jgi:hypothetical protein